MIIDRNWTWVGLFGTGAFAVGFALAVIALVQLRSSQYDNFDEARRKQLYITAWVYIGCVAAVFAVSVLVAISERRQGATEWVSRTVRTTTTTGGNQPAIF